MIYPKSIFICGKNWTIKKDEKLDCAGQASGNLVISINPTCIFSDAQMADTVLHECLEAILMMSGASYTSDEGKEMFYAFNHDKFRNQICPEILSVVRQLKLKGFK